MKIRERCRVFILWQIIFPPQAFDAGIELKMGKREEEEKLPMTGRKLCKLYSKKKKEEKALQFKL